MRDAHYANVVPFAVTKQSSKNLIWIDLEMSGLDPQNDVIIEIATIITDSALNILAEGPHLVIHQPETIMRRMDQWNLRQHTSSGLLQEVRDSALLAQEAEQQTLSFVQTWVAPQTSPMCGNTVCQDRRFLAHWMPKLEKWFHYRHIDVSTLKELYQRWVTHKMKVLQKDDSHRAKSDILASIDELRYYRQHFLVLPDLKTVS